MDLAFPWIILFIFVFCCFSVCVKFGYQFCISYSFIFFHAVIQFWSIQSIFWKLIFTNNWFGQIDNQISISAQLINFRSTLIDFSVLFLFWNSFLYFSAASFNHQFFPQFFDSSKSDSKYLLNWLTENQLENRLFWAQFESKINQSKKNQHQYIQFFFPEKVHVERLQFYSSKYPPKLLIFWLKM